MRSIGSLFSGIGGLELGLERSGLGHVVWQAEKSRYCRAVLARHWPNAKRFADVMEVTSANAARVDVVCGGFPCQPVSVAGRRAGGSDERWLWPEYVRIVRELAPAVVVAENVPGLRTLGLRDVLGDLAALGFDVEWACASAFDYGAPHLRRRIFIVATDPSRVHVRIQPGWLASSLERQAAPIPRIAFEGSERADANKARRQFALWEEPEQLEADGLAACRFSANPDAKGRLEQAKALAAIRGWSRHVGWDIGADPRVDDGLSGGLLGLRRAALGNAVVVQVAQAVGQAIREAVEETGEVAA